ncbi:MAG: hypothetical protein JXB15_15890 [Anaerolineales bacterium]|nr:hypothetical protein [Anaerolineales bacterium]
MSANTYQNQSVFSAFQRLRLQRGLAFGIIIITALMAFEIFNYSTTDYALTDLLGNLKFLGVRWATILSIAFCGIDFAGIARLFSPDSNSQASNGGRGASNHSETWYLFGAWLLAATMNAMLTWWGVSLAVLGHETLGNAVVERATLLRVVPVFVAILVWLIRVMIIGTFSVAGERLFGVSEPRRQAAPVYQPRTAIASGGLRQGNNRLSTPRNASASMSASRSEARIQMDDESVFSNSRPELTYHPMSASAPNSPNSQRPPLSRPGQPARR